MNRHQPSFASLLRHEYLKISRRLMLGIAVGLVALVTALLQIGGYLLFFVFEVVEVDEGGGLEAYLLPGNIEGGFFLMSLLGPILMIVLASGIVGSEYGWGTIRTVVGSGVSRTRLLLAKFVILAGLSVLLTLVCLVVLFVGGVAISLIEGLGLGLGWIDLRALGDLLLMILRCSFVLTVIGTLGFVTAQVARSVVAGLGIPLGVLFLSPLILVTLGALGSVGKRIGDLHLLVNGDVLDTMNTFGERRELELSRDPWLAAGILLLYGVIAIAIAIASFRRRDITV